MASISGERWLELSPYLDQALSLTASARSTWLAALHVSQPELAPDLETLLDDHRSLVERRFLEDSPTLPDVDDSSPEQIIGAYRLTGLLGEGGMGSVWAAERSDGRFDRRVAIKFLHFSVASGAGLERFHREGKILGQLRHPNVAELLDAGVTANGRPYLVLEYVAGQPIDAYCDEQKLTIDGRIRLFSTSSAPLPTRTPT